MSQNLTSGKHVIGALRVKTASPLLTLFLLVSSADYINLKAVWTQIRPDDTDGIPEIFFQKS